MIIKIGDKFYTGKEQPVLVYFTEKDKEVLREQLSNPDFEGYYAEFPYAKLTPEERESYIDEPIPKELLDIKQS